MLSAQTCIWLDSSALQLVPFRFFFLKNIRPKSSFDPCVLFPNFHIVFLYPKSFTDMFCCSHLTAPGQHCLHARIELSCKSHFYFGAWVRGNGE